MTGGLRTGLVVLGLREGSGIESTIFGRFWIYFTCRPFFFLAEKNLSSPCEARRGNRMVGTKVIRIFSLFPSEALLLLLLLVVLLTHPMRKFPHRFGVGCRESCGEDSVAWGSERVE